MSSRNLSLAQQLSNGQLPMYMTGSEIQKHYDLGDANGPSTIDGHKHPRRAESEPYTMVRKLDEAKEPRTDENSHVDSGFNRGTTSLYDSISEHGVKKPVEVQHPFDMRVASTVYEGHHRIAAQSDIDPNRLIPLKHTIGYEDLFSSSPKESK